MHLLISLSPTAKLSEIVQKLKANSSRWIAEHRGEFSWQEGYGAFSVSPSQRPAVEAYIARQEEHHRKRDSRAEFVALLERSGVVFDMDAV